MKGVEVHTLKQQVKFSNSCRRRQVPVCCRHNLHHTFLLRAEYSLSSYHVNDWSVAVRWFLLLGVLVTELLGLTIRFDTAALSKDDSWSTRLAGNAPEFIRISLAVVATFVLVLTPRFKATIQEVRQCSQAHLWQRWLLLHLLVFGAFYLTTSVVFERAAGGSHPVDVMLGFWSVLGIAVFAFWFLAVAPTQYWLGLLSRERLSLMVAVIAGTAAWLGGEITRQFWKPLAEFTFWLSEFLLRLLYSDVLSDSSKHVLGTSGFLVAIAPQCSGYEGIGLVIVFLTLYLWLFRTEIRFPHAFLLFPLGVLAIWIANTLRITTLIAIGTSYSRELALGGFHSQAGWIAFVAIALGLIFITRRFHLFALRKNDEAIIELNPIAAAMLVPLLVLMGSMMLTAAVTQDFDWLYPIRISATTAALLYFRNIYRQWDWSWSLQSIVIGTAVFIVWFTLEQATDSGARLSASVTALPKEEAVVWLAFRVIGSVVIIPLAEELAFRGYLIRRLVAAQFENVRPDQFTWLSFILSSVAFGLLHGRWFAGSLAGTAYALALYRRGKLGDAVVAHMTTNGLIALSVLVGGHWSLLS